MKANPRSDNDIDPVERCRQVRRELEQKFATADKFFDWLQRLDEERLAEARLKSRRNAALKGRPKRQSKRTQLPRKSAKSRSRS